MSALLEVLNAIEMYGMAAGGLSGQGFRFKEQIAQLRGLRRDLEATLTEYRAFSDRLAEASSVVFLESIAGNAAPHAQLSSLAPEMLVGLEERLEAARERRVTVVQLQRAVDAQREAGEKLLAMPEFYQLTGGLGTSAPAQVIGVTQDLYTIKGITGQIISSLDQLIVTLQTDIERVTFYSRP